MATKDKTRYLDLTLASLLGQTHRDVEVVVTDDGGAEPARGVVDRYRGALAVTLVEQPPAGRAAARNAAVARASGDVVIFTDDDRVLPPDFVEQHLAALPAAGGAVIGWKRRMLTFWEPGALRLAEADGPRVAAVLAGADATRAQALTSAERVRDHLDAEVDRLSLGDDRDNYDHVLAAYGDDLDGFLFPWALATTANLAVPRSALSRGPVFDERFRGWGMEDTDLGYRLHRAGVRFTVRRSAVNYHQVHPLGAGTLVENEAERLADLHRNLALFVAAHDSLEAHLYESRWHGHLDMLAADRLLRLARQDPSGVLERELLRLYRR
jgi:glycosyltransferase involved in cell wall biosynthesis